MRRGVCSATSATSCLIGGLSVGAAYVITRPVGGQGFTPARGSAKCAAKPSGQGGFGAWEFSA